MKRNLKETMTALDIPMTTYFVRNLSDQQVVNRFIGLNVEIDEMAHRIIGLPFHNERSAGLSIIVNMEQAYYRNQRIGMMRAIVANAAR